ncbi:uncharacterized protein LOC143222869 [Tachypleus tridentatus]|uniref:uncharacterized protein LOC143222869 n=1 Tax=Tachypleus tridentatus TaxID=6853 RepID=UPI003FD3F919
MLPEKQKSNAEATRRYREKIKDDPERYQQYLQKERERYLQREAQENILDIRKTVKSQNKRDKGENENMSKGDKEEKKMRKLQQ